MFYLTESFFNGRRQAINGQAINARIPRNFLFDILCFE